MPVPRVDWGRVAKSQVRFLKKIIDEHSTNFVPSWFFLDAPMLFEAVPGATDPIFGEPGDFEKALSKNQPFRCWYSHGNSCYHSVDENVETLLDMIKEVAPDVIICFSQASNCISMALDALRRKGVAVPWKVTVMFSGGHIDDPIFDWQGWTSHHPTLRVFNAGKDTFFDGGEGSLQHMYPEIVEFPHTDGHMFPHSEPRASEIYNQVADEIYARCGKKKNGKKRKWQMKKDQKYISSERLMVGRLDKIFQKRGKTTKPDIEKWVPWSNMPSKTCGPPFPVNHQGSGSDASNDDSTICGRKRSSCRERKFGCEIQFI